jgi:DNA-binding beta-propeller fold protein YncE
MVKLNRLSMLFAAALCLTAVSVGAQEATPEMTPEATPMVMPMEFPDRVTAVREGLFPEGVEYDSVNGRFLVSSTSEGTVYAVADDGTVTPFIQDGRIPASLGLEVDEAGNRLLVAATDQEREGYLGIYDLTSGENLAWVDFALLTPNDPEHFVNDVAVDSQGNAYVTDSFAGVIYRVDPQGNASIFLEDESFSTQFALNGIAYAEDGDYLIAVRVPDLIKIPLANPAGFAPVQLDTPLVGADGIVFLDNRTLIVVTNNPAHVYRLESDDQFVSAQMTGEFAPGNVFPTTAAVREGSAYVLYAQLNAETSSVAQFPIQRVPFYMPLSEATPEATPQS